jgi:hypothetical protein
MRRLALFALVLACNLFAPAAEPVPSAIVATVSAQGEIKFDTIEEFLVGQGAAQSKSKVRLLPETKGSVDPNAIKKLSKVELSQAGVLRNDGSGRLIHVAETGREVVLPEDYSLKVADKAENVPGPLTLTLVRSKKNKQIDTLDPKLFYAFLSGTPTDRVVFEFVSNAKAFGTLDEQLRAMEGFVKSFPGQPAVADLRAQLERQMSTELIVLENGGPFADLLRTQRFGELARRAFPADAALQKLYERILDRRKFIEDRGALMTSLALAGDWDLVLENYKDFERYQPSFPSLVSLRQQAYEESARAHSRRARGFSQRQDHEDGTREASVAQSRDPNNKDIGALLEEQKHEDALTAARLAEKNRKPLQPALETPFNRAIQFANNAIRDKEYAQAEMRIEEARRVNPEAPEIYLMNAKLLLALDRLSESLDKLDVYDRMVINPADRQTSETVRNDVLYAMQRKKDATSKDIAALLKNKEYSKLDQLLRDALVSDPNDLDYLYNGGIGAAVMRNTDRAKKLLASYMEKSDSLAGDRGMRDRAGRVLNSLNAEKPAAASDGTANWLTGRKLPDNVYYDPESLAFQLPITSVTGNKITWTFDWDKQRLQSIQTAFEDTNGNALRLFRQLGAGGAQEADAAGAADDPGSFFFRYLEPGGPLLGVRTRGPKPLTAVGPGPAPKAPSFRVVVASKGANGPLYLADEEQQPEIVFPSHSLVDIGILNVLEGQPLGTTIAGNSVFNPFMWDGLHYFTVTYDAQGHADTAQEWGVDNRVMFSWDGQRLKEIRAYHKDSSTPYYRRSITYKGALIDNEEVTMNSKSAGGFEYVYSSTGKGQQQVLKQIKIKSDGKDWVATPRS